MAEQTILVLGGYGSKGKVVCRWLLKDMERMGVKIQVSKAVV